MARKLSSKYEVIVFDIEPAKMQKMTNVKRARDIAEVGKFAKVVILSLPTSEVVREVVVGSNGLGEHLGRGGIIIYTSTTEPRITLEISRILKAKDISLLDAPVSGGEKAAIDGTLSFMVGVTKRYMRSVWSCLRLWVPVWCRWVKVVWDR